MMSGVSVCILPGWIWMKIMRKENRFRCLPWRVQDPIKDFDFLGMTIAVRNVLYEYSAGSGSGVGSRLQSAHRTWSRTVPSLSAAVPAPTILSPLPISFDIFYIGEGETQYRPLIDLYKKCRTDEDRQRRTSYAEAAKLPGMYVPPVSMRPLTMKMAPLLPFDLRKRDIPASDPP